MKYVVALFVFSFACSAPRAVAAPPVVRPCLEKKPPERARIISVIEPTKIPYVDEHGNQNTAFAFAATPESMTAFFDYVMAIEALAKHAYEGCVSK